MDTKKSGGIEFRSEYVDLHESCTVRWTWTPALGSKANAPDHYGMRELDMWEILVGT